MHPANPLTDNNPDKIHRITCGNDIRTLYTLNLLGKEVTRINPIAKHEIEVTVNEDSANR